MRGRPSCEHGVAGIVTRDHVVRKGLGALLALVGCAHWLAASAATSWEPQLALKYDYSDNQNLAEGPAAAEETYGGRLLAALEWRSFTERSEMLLRPQIRLSRYRGDIEESRSDYYLFARGKYDWQTARVGLLADYSRVTKLTSDLADVPFPTDPGASPPDQTDTGIVTTRGYKESLYITPNVAWDVTERTSLGARYGFLQVDYIDVPPGGGTDFTNNEIDLTVDHAFTQRLTLGVFLTAGKYETDVNNVQTDYQEGGASLTYKPSEQTIVEAVVGAHRSDTSSSAAAAVEENVTDPFGWLQWTYRAPRDLWQFYAGRSFDPSGNGTLSRRDQARFNWDRRLTERLTSTAGMRWIQSESTTILGIESRRDYGRAELGLRWLMTRMISVGATASYTYQDFYNRPGSATAWGAMLDMTYGGPGNVPRR